MKFSSAAEKEGKMIRVSSLAAEKRNANRKLKCQQKSLILCEYNPDLSKPNARN